MTTPPTTPLPSIRSRVTRTLLWMSLCSCVLMGAVVWWIVGHEIDELMDQGLRESAEIIHNVLANQPPAPAHSTLPLPHTDYEEHLVWQIIDSQRGQVLARSHKAPTSALHPRPMAHTTHSADGEWRIVTLGLQHSPTRFLLVAQSESERYDARTESLVYTLVSALLAGGVGILLLSLRLRQELQPLQQLSQAVQHYDPLQPATDLASAERAELEPITQAVRELGQRLAQRFRSERAFTAHAAHALRTPLAGIDAQLAIALKEAPPSLQPRLNRARQGSQRLSRVMQALLTMFRSGTEPQWQAVPLSVLLAPWPHDGLAIVAKGDPTLHADPDLLAAVLMNLLDNARQHGATQVQLRAASPPDGQQTLHLHDNGPGCPAATLQRLRQALQQHDYTPGTGLSGLGLMLADLVLQAHGGSVALPNVNTGFAVLLQWPQPPEKSA